MAELDDKEAQRARLRQALSQRQSLSIPKIQETQDLPSPDDNAQKEASAIASGDLEAESAKREHGRTERFRDNVAWAILIIFWLGFGGIILAAILWAADFFFPWFNLLDSSQSDRIISFLGGGGLTGFVTNYAKKRLS